MDKDTREDIQVKGDNPKYDEEYLNRLIARATPAWEDVTDEIQWVSEIRGE